MHQLNASASTVSKYITSSKLKKNFTGELVVGPACTSNRRKTLLQSKLNQPLVLVMPMRIKINFYLFLIFQSTILSYHVYFCQEHILSFETSAKARAALLIDQTTGTVLLSKNADQPLPPASMSKLNDFVYDI